MLQLSTSRVNTNTEIFQHSPVLELVKIFLNNKKFIYKNRLRAGILRKFFLKLSNKLKKTYTVNVMFIKV